MPPEGFQVLNRCRGVLRKRRDQPLDRACQCTLGLFEQNLGRAPGRRPGQIHQGLRLDRRLRGVPHPGGGLSLLGSLTDQPVDHQGDCRGAPMTVDLDLGWIAGDDDRHDLVAEPRPDPAEPQPSRSGFGQACPRAGRNAASATVSAPGPQTCNTASAPRPAGVRTQTRRGVRT